MKDIRKLKELILEKVDLSEVMLQYGVKFVFNPHRANEVQYKCPFHGHDTKPSARFYRETKSCWCWKCHKYWDVVEFIKDKENLKYVSAILYIIKRYNIDTSSIPDAPDLSEEKFFGNELNANLLLTKNHIRIKRGQAPLVKYGALVTAWYMVAYHQSLGHNISEQLSKLDQKVGLL